MKHLSGDGAFLRPTAQSGLARAGGGAVFPPGAEIAAHNRYLRGEVLLNVAEEILRAGQDELRVFPLRVPLLRHLGNPGSDAYIVTEGAVDKDGVVGVAGFLV